MFLNGDIRQIKKNIREECKQLRRSMTPQEKLRRDSDIFHRLENLWKYRSCDLVLTYVSREIEVDTHTLIADALRRGKRVAAPRCIDGAYEMEFFLIKDRSDLEKGSYGLLEPVEDRCERLLDYSGALCIVPALCFDERGYRLGFGKGYYDRFLADFPGATVGLCYEDCIRRKLPNGRFDRCADIVVTEKRVITKT